ncbi:MAG: hypothetical protein KDA41_01050, partial [Planctomycetales bacterium]|nr:hypothetical protein [Planctomycetales bacterium]
MTQWHLNPIAGSLVLLAAVAVAAGVSLLPTFKPLPRARRVGLTALRLSVVLLALLLMLRPTRVRTITRPASALLVLLFDQSRSMTVPDMPDGGTRWASQQAMMTEAAAILRDMPPNIETKV